MKDVGELLVGLCNQTALPFFAQAANVDVAPREKRAMTGGVSLRSTLRAEVIGTWFLSLPRGTAAVGGAGGGGSPPAKNNSKFFRRYDFHLEEGNGVGI